MMHRFWTFLRNFDWILLISVLLLAIFGLIEIYSIALGQGVESGGSDFSNFKKQLMFFGIGLFLLFLFAFFDYKNLYSYSNYIYGVGVIILLLVLQFGREVNGTTGWFRFAGLSLQPVEFIKFIVILFLARYFSQVSLKVNPFKHLFVSASGVLLLMALIMAQPDFGSGLLLFIIWCSMIVVAGFEKKYFVIIGLVMAVSLAGAWGFFFKEYQKQRILTFFQPSYDPLDQGYNVAQAIIAVGAGGLTGRGIGFGSQSQLKFLPESQNDFIFAVVAEELGFVGVSLVVFFYSLFFFRAIYILRKINNDFGIFFILGCVSLIFIEMFINIGMNIGILPVVGISLPFISYGGSALVATMVMVGVMESIIVRAKINY